MILDWLAAQADPILALAGMVFVSSLVPQAWHQWRVKASTVPLSTSVPTALTLAVITLVFAALGMWLTAVTDVFTTALWAVIAGQRVRYDGPMDGALCGSCGRVFELNEGQEANQEDGRYYCPECCERSWA